MPHVPPVEHGTAGKVGAVPDHLLADVHQAERQGQRARRRRLGPKVRAPAEREHGDARETHGGGPPAVRAVPHVHAHRARSGDRAAERVGGGLRRKQGGGGNHKQLCPSSLVYDGDSRRGVPGAEQGGPGSDGDHVGAQRQVPARAPCTLPLLSPARERHRPVDLRGPAASGGGAESENLRELFTV